MKKILLIVMLLMGCQLLYANESIQIKGSDTIVNLAQRFAEEYMKQNPSHAISVSGGGSGVGISSLLNGSTDIANASRELKEKEIAQFKSKNKEIKQVVIAIDALSIIVNPKNPIKTLTKDQVGAIYRGKLTNWKDVGGPNKPISLYGRQPNSGTYDFLREHVLAGEYSPKMMQMNGNSQIVAAVSKDISGIGYVGVGYIEQDGKTTTLVKSLLISEKTGEKAYSPTDKPAVYSGKYPISRGLNQFINGTPTGLVKAFIEFELSPMGAKIVQEEGFYPVKGDYTKINAETLQ